MFQIKDWIINEIQKTENVFFVPTKIERGKFTGRIYPYRNPKKFLIQYDPSFDEQTTIITLIHEYIHLLVFSKYGKYDEFANRLNDFEMKQYLENMLCIEEHVHNKKLKFSNNNIPLHEIVTEYFVSIILFPNLVRHITPESIKLVQDILDNELYNPLFKKLTNYKSFVGYG